MSIFQEEYDYIPDFETKVDEESAHEEFKRILKAYDVFITMSTMDDKEKVDFKNRRADVIRGIMTGRLRMNAEGLVEYECKNMNAKFSFKQTSFAHLIETDKGEGDMKKATMLLGALVGLPASQTAKISGFDKTVLQSLMLIFLA